MKSFKQQCIELRQKDHTLNEIVKITGRGKTSVYFHIKDIQLSKKKQKAISEYNRQSALKLSDARRGKALRPYKPFKKWTPDLVLLVAHLIFDGEIRPTGCGYANRSQTLINRVCRLFTHVYSFEPHTYFDQRSGVHQIRYYNVALASFIEAKAAELIKNIQRFPLSQQREFVRAFFDDEGCMDYRPKSNKRRIRGYQKNRQVLLTIRDLLANFGIEAKVREPNEVVISGKANLQKFQTEINFSPGVRLNPRRANSIWRQPIEKRVLLERAIRSFK